MGRGECGDVRKVPSKRCGNVSAKGIKFHVSHERFVQAIRGFLLGFRRGDSVTSKTRAIGKIKCVVFLLEIPTKSACERIIEIVFVCFA